MILSRSNDRICQGLRVRWPNEEPGLAILDELAGPGNICSNHRYSDGHSFHGGDWQPLDKTWKDKKVGTPQRASDFVFI